MTGYVFMHEGKGYSPDGTVHMSREETAEHNRQLEAQELETWKLKPDSFVAYLSQDAIGGKVTTWLGAQIGQVSDCTYYRSNLNGARMAAIRIIASNGAEYYGRKGRDWTQAIRLRRAKKAKYPL